MRAYISRRHSHPSLAGMSAFPGLFQQALLKGIEEGKEEKGIRTRERSLPQELDQWVP